MATILIVAAALAAGAVLAYLALRRGAGAAAAAGGDLSARLAAARAEADELRAQLAAARTESGELHERLRAEAGARAAAEARVEETRRALAEQRQVIDEARAKLGETFGALAADALRASSRELLTLAEERLKTLGAQSAGELEARKTAIEGLVGPLRAAIDAYQKEARELEDKRAREIGGVAQQLADLSRAQAALHESASRLATALRGSNVRGRWGEITLKRTAELAGMVAHCDFFEQETVERDGGRSRPDMIVRLPGGREIVVDSKVPLDAYLESLEAPAPEAREAALARHAQQVRAAMRRLAQRDYASQLPRAPEFVVLFIPGDPFLGAAVDKDPALLPDALAARVLIATPTSLVGLLLTVAHAWRQEQVAENAERISRLGRDLYDRLSLALDHFARLGRELSGAVDAYNSAVGSIESRLLPAARRFEELGAAGDKQLPAVEPVTQAPRRLAAPEAAAPEAAAPEAAEAEAYSGR